MSDENTKEKHSKRRHNTYSVIEKRRKLLKQYNMNWYNITFNNQYHRLSKMNGMNCGNPDCMLCMNPRKYGEKTIQELSFEQTEKWIDE
jgi:hypothetical protein